MRLLRGIVIVAVGLFGLAVPVSAAAAAPAASPVKHCEFIPTPDKPAAKPVHPPRPAASTRGTATVYM